MYMVLAASPLRTAILPIREMSHLTERRVTWEEEAAFWGQTAPALQPPRTKGGGKGRPPSLFAAPPPVCTPLLLPPGFRFLREGPSWNLAVIFDTGGPCLAKRSHLFFFFFCVNSVSWKLLVCVNEGRALRAGATWAGGGGGGSASLRVCARGPPLRCSAIRCQVGWRAGGCHTPQTQSRGEFGC